LDGQDGGGNYYRGIGWYRAHYTVDGGYAGRHCFLKFDGASLVTDVYVNGTFVGEHRGGFAAFVFDVTPFLNVGADNVIAVKVNNARNTDVPPLGGDFTVFGGIYRDMHLLVTDPVHISPLDYGSPGVYLQTTNVSASSAALQVTTVVSNANATAKAVMLRATVFDAASNTVAVLSNALAMAAGTASNVVQKTSVASPHLWNGLADPYLYRVLVEIVDGPNVIDQVSQPLGFRWFSVDPDKGFFLNGRAYDLHGVNMHQDWLDKGWALSNAERETNFMIIKELGATALRLAHYQHDDYTCQLADQNGIVLWAEVPLVGGATASDAFNINAEQQMAELIRQQRNHPSVVCWGTFNEIGGSAAERVVSNLVQMAHREDPTRPTTAASNARDNAAINWLPDITAFNKYFGWYIGATPDFGPYVNDLHATYPTRCVGISEYGAGASIRHHSEDPVPRPNANNGPHPEEWQNKVHEETWLQMKERPYLWCRLIWNMFNFASDGRNEGDTPGRNDKGLVTYDRQIRKDAFYWYKANWTTNPMVYVTGHTFTNRLTNSITAKVYTNCDSVKLLLNGVSQGTRRSTNCIFTWPVALAGGSNYVQAIGTKGGSNVTDSLIWIGPITPPSAAIISRPDGLSEEHQ
jgi:beta-galactosidase